MSITLHTVLLLPLAGNVGEFQSHHCKDRSWDGTLGQTQGLKELRLRLIFQNELGQELKQEESVPEFDDIGRATWHQLERK